MENELIYSCVLFRKQYHLWTVKEEKLRADMLEISIPEYLKWSHK